MAHVWTQMPYALLVAVVSIAAGTIPVGFGVSLWFALPVSALLLVCLLWCFGRVPEEDRATVADQSED
jgi:Na+/H+ antiporter NhaC